MHSTSKSIASSSTMQGGFIRLTLVVGLVLHVANAFYSGQFESEAWVKEDAPVAHDALVKFIVALKTHDTQHMHDTLMELSNPASSSYGRYMSLEDISARYGPSKEEREHVLNYFRTIAGATVSGGNGELFEVTAPVNSIHKALKTELGWVVDTKQRTEKRSLRAMKPISIPEDLHQSIAFVSLNAPVNHAMPKAAKSMATRRKEALKAMNVEFAKDHQFDNAMAAAASGQVGISPGNQEALAFFKPYCGSNATLTNQENPPCKSSTADDTPTFTVAVSEHANILNNNYLITQEPKLYTVSPSTVYCYNTVTTQACSGTDGNDCTCIAKISNLPKYTQLRMNITATYPSSSGIQTLGSSDLFALTDTATASFLSTLYNIPQGMSVQHGSNQSVAEFYGEFYSNSDLMQFLSLSGLPNATIPVENVYGDLANDQSNPGGEAQLDVEYIMALAPNADTYFYSFSDLNPYDPVNEGFLAYLTYVSNQPYPPLVHSVSYGDDMANIFNSSNSGSVEYGQSCDIEFMKLGLRGITFLLSSGDDGIGSSAIRDDPMGACSSAKPEWPTGSPYVTSIGATMLTDKHLPVCNEQYTVSSAYPDMPVSNQLNFQCTGTGETVCTSTFGGVITSGGGFSNVADRNTYAPWQSDAVDKYLSPANAASYPPLSYFNATGRAYPDVATYGSNYFVYLAGKITRESGTSASAPVFAAMVTLWNDMRLAYNLPPMGFIAPFLYYIQAKVPDAFQDITTGNNACGAGYSIETVNCCEYSFAASAGWDAVTGLGSPNFQVISNLVLNNATYFPNLGAYPTGTTSSNSISSDDDDSTEQKDISMSGLIIAVVAFVLAIVAIVMSFTICRSKPAMSSSTSSNSAV